MLPGFCERGEATWRKTQNYLFANSFKESWLLGPQLASLKGKKVPPCSPTIDAQLALLQMITEKVGTAQMKVTGSGPKLINLPMTAERAERLAETMQRGISYFHSQRERYHLLYQSTPSAVKLERRVFIDCEPQLWSILEEFTVKCRGRQVPKNKARCARTLFSLRPSSSCRACGAAAAVSALRHTTKRAPLAKRRDIIINLEIFGTSVACQPVFAHVSKLQ